MDEDASVDESPPTSPARSVRARAASPPAAERKEEVDISKHVAMMRARSKEIQDLGLVDVVSYNTLLKAYLKQGQIVKAHEH